MRSHLVIRGHVQGVAYRWSARRQALSLGLVGWIRNCGDGSVEAVAEGPDEAVHAFTAWCRRGPEGALVSEVRVHAAEPGPSFSDFMIRH